MILGILTFTWGLVAIGWFAPGVFKIAGAALYALGEGFEKSRVIFETNFSTYRGKGIHPVPPSPKAPSPAANPAQQDVVDGLIAQGCPKRRAEVAAYRAAAAIPKGSFDELWRMAVKEAA